MSLDRGMVLAEGACEAFRKECAHDYTSLENLFDGGDQLLWSTLLRQVGRRTGFERTQRILLFGMQAQDHLGEKRIIGLQRTEDLQPLSVRQIDVQDDDIPVFFLHGG